MDVTDVINLKVGDVIQLYNGDIHVVSDVYNGSDHWVSVNTTNGSLILRYGIEKRLNKYHIGDRVKTKHFKVAATVTALLYQPLTGHTLYKIKHDDPNEEKKLCVYEEDLQYESTDIILRSEYLLTNESEEKKVTWYAPLDNRCNRYNEKENVIMNEEKKVRFKVGDYVKTNSMNEYPRYFGHLGIIVATSFEVNRWGVYFFSLKDMIYVEEKFLTQSEYGYEVKIKPDNVIKQALNSYYGCCFNSERYTHLKAELNRLPKIKKVIFNGPATIVMWDDGDKTVVHCGEGEVMDKEKGLAMAICKKALGKSRTHYDYYNVFKKWIKEDK